MSCDIHIVLIYALSLGYIISSHVHDCPIVADVTLKETVKREVFVNIDVFKRVSGT